MFSFSQVKILQTNIESISNKIIASFDFYVFLKTDHEIIELFKNENKEMQGNMIHFVSDSSEKYLYEIQKLNKKKVNQIIQLFDSLKIHSIPTDNNIICWGKTKNDTIAKRSCNDGITYIIETKEDNIIQYKTYSCPNAWNCKEARTISFFFQKISSIIESEKTFQKFIKKLPNGCYHTGSFYKFCN